MMPLGRRPLIMGTAMSGLVLTAAPVRATEFAAPCGPLRGLVQDGVATYFGIPYAAPPVGRLRYASPHPAAPWTEPRDATRPGAAAIQTLGGAAAWLYEPMPDQSEDCLFLNVWAPVDGVRRPVMVWLHGGAWRAGRGDAAGTRGARLGKDGDVVVVTINYRLGALG